MKIVIFIAGAWTLASVAVGLFIAPRIGEIRRMSSAPNPNIIDLPEKEPAALEVH